MSRTFFQGTPSSVAQGFSLLLLLFTSVFSSQILATEGVATKEAWPMFRGNPGLTGVSPANLPEKPTLLWTYKTGRPVKSSAAIVAGKVFIGSGDKQLHCINLQNGQKIWTFPTEGEVESSPLVLDGKVYFGSADGFLYALDATGGKELWKFQTQDKILGSPNWTTPEANTGPRSIVVGSYDFNLYSLDASSGKTNWFYETGNYINGTPAIAKGKTVFGGCDALLHVIALEKGEKVKEIEAGAYIAGSGAFENGRFYIGHYENEFLCADINEGKMAWRFKENNFPYFSSPALTADRVIFGGRDKRLHCLKKETGEKLWSFATRAKVDSSPVISGNKVVFGSEDGFVYMVNLEDGKEIWNYEIGGGITSSPGVVEGIFVIGSEDGNVYAFGRK